jgi:cyclase
MLAKRIIPCLDVKDGKVVKGIRFRNHQIMGDIIALAKYYAAQGADELVFYDITASSDQRTVDTAWICQVAQNIDIPFCVAGGIRTLVDAEIILNAGADKISINSPALENPALITELAKAFGTQCIVVGIDSIFVENQYRVCQYTGSAEKSMVTARLTQQWCVEVADRGAGEIVLNCMDQDGVRQGYALAQLQAVKRLVKIPVIASGGAGSQMHFKEVFLTANVDGALAASVFHSGEIEIPLLKQYLSNQGIQVRL